MDEQLGLFIDQPQKNRRAARALALSECPPGLHAIEYALLVALARILGDHTSWHVRFSQLVAGTGWGLRTCQRHWQTLKARHLVDRRDGRMLGADPAVETWICWSNLIDSCSAAVQQRIARTLAPDPFAVTMPVPATDARENLPASAPETQRCAPQSLRCAPAAQRCAPAAQPYNEDLPKELTHPPPPPLAPQLRDRETDPEEAWRAAAAALSGFGLTRLSCLDVARGRGCSPQQILELVAHARAHQLTTADGQVLRAWGAGAVYWRVRDLYPGVPVTWPDPDRAYAQERDRRLRAPVVKQQLANKPVRAIHSLTD